MRKLGSAANFYGGPGECNDKKFVKDAGMFMIDLFPQTWSICLLIHIQAIIRRDVRIASAVRRPNVAMRHMSTNTARSM